MSNVTLFQFGLVQFQVWPLNVSSYDHLTGADFAKKEVVDGPIRREHVGEKDEVIPMRGQVFPLAIGGFQNLEALETARREATAHILVRGGGSFLQNLGWFVIEDLRRGHEYLAANGVGRVISFEALFARVDTPRAASYYNDVFTMLTQAT